MTAPDLVERAPRLVTPALACVFVASFGAMISFFLLLSVVPLYVSDAGVGTVGAGLTTGILLLTTVATELAVPWLTNRFGHRALFTVGLLLLGAPALALPTSAALTPVVMLSGIRGIGFGIVVVLGGALAASLVPPERRGEGLGLLGVVMGVPGVLALPFGVFLVGHIGYPAVLIAGAVAALLGLVAMPGLPGRGALPAEAGPPADEPARELSAGPSREPSPGPSREPDPPQLGILAGLRMPHLLRPSLAFSATAVAAGVIATFLPLAMASQDLAALALLIQTTCSTLARWWAGRYGDRRGAARLVIPGLLAAAAGMAALVLVNNPVAVMIGTALFGSGYGISQNASLALMFERVPSTGYATVSAVWNLAFDGGMGLGAMGFGLTVEQTGYPIAFALTGALVLVALVPAYLDRRSPRPPRDPRPPRLPRASRAPRPERPPRPPRPPQDPRAPLTDG